jgi:DNA-binding transcriptional LysR family regulator
MLEPLYACEYVCVMRRDHDLAAHRVLSLDAYCAAEHVRVSFAGRPRGFVDEALAARDRQRRVVLTVNQFATAARVVHDSDLLSVLPRSFVGASGLADGSRCAPSVRPAVHRGRHDLAPPPRARPGAALAARDGRARRQGPRHRRAARPHADRAARGRRRAA